MKKKFYLVFDWNFIESESDFGRMVIFVILSLQIHENMWYKHFLVSYSNSFFIYLEFLLYRSFTSLFRLLPSNFIFFDNGNVFKISYSMFLYQYAEKLLIFVHWLWSPQVSWICISRSFLVEIWGSLMYNIWPANRDSLTSSLPTCITLISFTFLIVQGSSLRTILRIN